MPIRFGTKASCSASLGAGSEAAMRVSSKQQAGGRYTMLRFLVIAVAVSACAGSDVGPSVGQVQASLTGSPGNGGGQSLGVKEIIVTIDKVTAHSTSAGWVTLTGSTTTVDILKLAQYAQQLGFANMPAGKVTQLRLYVKEGGTQYVTTDAGARVDLKVPSGIQSGIKLKGLFDVNGCQSSNVPLTFDGKRSIWVHPTGQGDEWILRPVIRTGKIDVADMGCTPTGSNPGGMLPPEGPGGHGRGNPPVNSGAGSPPGSTSGTPPGGPTEGPGNGMGGAGAPCSNGSMCLSGSCVANVCGLGGPDAPCNMASDCASGACTTGACAPGGAAGSGSPCTGNTQCLSNACVNGLCEKGGQGQPCSILGDCLDGFTCSAGSCIPPPN
jgi:hypothetical protein